MDTRDAGRKGGKAGKGASKRRGDSAYYRALRAKAKKKAAKGAMGATRQASH